MKVFVIVTDENNLGEITTDCAGVFFTKEAALKRLNENAIQCLEDEELPEGEYNKEVIEDYDNFYFSAQCKGNGDIEYTMFQGIIEKEIED